MMPSVTANNAIHGGGVLSDGYDHNLSPYLCMEPAGGKDLAEWIEINPSMRSEQKSQKNTVLLTFQPHHYQLYA